MLNLFTVNYIWNPVLNVDNAIAFTSVSKDSIRVYSNGLVEYVNRIKLTVPSEHNLKKFPFETRNCTIHFTNDDSRAIWSKIINIKFPKEDSISQWIPIKSETISNYHNLRLRMRRSITTWLYTYFLTTFLLVFVSWLPAWMNTRAQIPRISVGAICFFSILVLVLSKSSSIPSTPYLKAIDLWNLAICGFSFLSFLHSAIVISHSSTTSKSSRRNRSFDDDGCDTAEKHHWISETPYYAQLSQPNYLTTPKICDYIFRFVAPICFGTFVAFFVYVYSAEFWKLYA
uniref:Neurotransmitter-gated ion-channel ligand-binding domain-containing protein n=1 Tax=Panagrolaimus superbus TaxID=310955 RepID=A0A914Y0R0_9BILA